LYNGDLVECLINEQKQKAQELKSEINRVDAEIDNIVYLLYGLNENKIKIVEEKV